MVGLLLLLFAQDMPEVEAVRAPFQGHRPQAVIDDDGVVHVVQGSSKHKGDLFYTKRDPKSGEFSDPIQVNTAPGITAGFSFAVGQGGRIHVLIRPNPTYLRMKMPEKEKLKFWDLKYMLYCRMNEAGTGFEPERDLSDVTLGFEGIGTILADGEGRVYAFWHGALEPKPDESLRKIFRVVSTDGGKTFSKPEAVECEAVGACQCCGMTGLLQKDGTIALAFRNAKRLLQKRMTKDSYLLVSEDEGRSFKATHLESWRDAGCPGSASTLAEGPAGLFVGWRTKTKVMFAKEAETPALISPTLGATTRVPTLACNKDGVVLFAWGARNKKTKGGGSIVWELFDEDGKSISKKKVVANGVAERWGSFAIVALPDGSFLILYDGPGSGH